MRKPGADAEKDDTVPFGFTYAWLATARVIYDHPTMTGKRPPFCAGLLTSTVI